MTTSMLTQNLREALAHSRAVLDDWVEQELQAADAQAVAAANKVSQKQHEIDAASAKLLALQLESGLSMNDENSNNNTENLANALVKRKQLEQQVENQKVKNSKLDATLEEQKKELEDLLAEHKHQKARAVAANQQAAMVTASKETTVNDLTRGIVNYKWLGLDFEKADNERLRFSFTQLDPERPDQKYSFCLEATDDELWSVVECEPPVLADETVQELVAPLNNTNDMIPFVRGMRRAFLQHIDRD